MVLDAAFDSSFGGTEDPDDHVYQIIRLLRNASSDEWSVETPDILQYWDRSQQEKGPGAGQPAHLYVWSPTTSTLERFSMDGTRFDRTDAIEIQIWSLDDTVPHRLQSNVKHILGKYIDDNRVNTPYSTVEPTGLNDYREQKTARRTDHYVMSVEVDARGLDVTRSLDSGVFTEGFDAGFA